MKIRIFNYNDLQDIAPVEAGWQKCTPLYSFGPFTRNEYIFHYVLSGKGYCSCGPELDLHRPDSPVKSGEKSPLLEVHAGEGFLFEPHMQHAYFADQEHPWCYVWIVFKGLAVPQYLHACGLTKQNLIYRGADKSAAAIQRISHHLMELLEEGDAPTAFVMGHLHLFFAELAKNAAQPFPDVLNEERFSNFYITQAVHYINCYYRRIRSLDEIAVYCNLSRSHLSRLFRQHLQISLQDYLIQTRLNKASVLLTQTALPIQEIADQVGYQNELNLLRAFKTRYGISPSDYRRQNTL